MKSPAFMTLEELDKELAQYGYYRRDRKTVDESFPKAKWVIIAPSSTKYGASSTIEVATIVLKIQKGTI